MMGLELSCKSSRKNGHCSRCGTKAKLSKCREGCVASLILEDEQKEYKVSGFMMSCSKL